MTDKVQINFLLTPAEKGLLDSVAHHFEMTRTGLLRRWIYDEATAILEPLVQQALDFDIAEDDGGSLAVQLRKPEVQQFAELTGIGNILVGMLQR